jgi:hypothetical protein
MMQQISTYQITVQGQVTEDDLDGTSPLKITVMDSGMQATQFTIFTDQAGLIGALRHLHGRGFVLLSMKFER